MFQTFSDKRVSNILDYGFRTRVIGTLGAMVNVDSSVFYTSVDIAFCILDRQCIKIESLESHDVRSFISAISSVLSQAHRKGLSDVYRTNRRIQPKYMHGRASYGYRIGLAHGRRVINPEHLAEHKEIASQPRVEERESPTALNIGEKAVALMEYHELCQMELTIQQRKEELYRSLEKQLGAKK